MPGGLAAADLLGDAAAVEPLFCRICDSLVQYESAAHTSCAHVFCRSCLDEWFASAGAASCPTCRAQLATDGVAELRKASPLGWRLLGRVQCRCPLRSQGCTWTGEYSELNTHLTSAQTHLGQGVGAELDEAVRAARARAEAEGLKEAGNAKFGERAYHDAIKLYSKAIAAAGAAASGAAAATYYGNRAAAWHMVGAFRECAADCRAALALDPAYAKGYTRLAKALCELGDFEEAHATLQRAAVLGVGGGGKAAAELEAEGAAVRELVALMREGGAAAAAGDHGLAAELFGEAARRSSAPAVALAAAASELARGNAERAQRLTLQLLRADATCVRALALRGQALLASGDFDQATKHLREALRLDPDDGDAARALKRLRRVQAATEAGRAAAFGREFETAVAELSSALSAAELPPAAPLAAALLAERGAARLRLKDLDAALADCEAAIAGREDCKPAYLTLASALQAVGRHEEALRRLRALAAMDPADAVVSRHVSKAEFELRKARRPDYYELLGCGRTASANEVKAAYRARALECHPDRLPPDAAPELRAAAEARFKAVGEALEVLSEPLKKQLYDEGYDREAIEERVAAAQRAAHERGSGGGHHHHHHHHAGAGCGGDGGCGSCG